MENWSRAGRPRNDIGVVSPNEKLANALTVLTDLQGGGRRVFRSGQFARTHRERLVRNGHLRPVVKGWLMLSHPDAPAHDTTAWYESFWEFCARYCVHRFGDGWHLLPELSLRLQAEDTSVPRQVIVHAQGGRNNTLRLPFETSLFDLRAAVVPEPPDICEWQGLRVCTVDAALVQVPARFFRDCPVEARTALAGVRQVGGIVRRLLAGSRSTVAGRLAGAFRHIGRAAFADEIRHAMRNTEHDSFRESNPFADEGRDGPPAAAVRGFEAPIVGRLRELWARSRGSVLAVCPGAPGLPSGDSARRRYLDGVTAAYLDDAYHSLSIEGYRVTPKLIERVRSGTWNPETVADDEGQRDALSARGYWQAFQAVRASIDEILGGADASAAFRLVHGRWYFEMFQPFVAAGLYGAGELAGYRNRPVFLRGSRHVPPRVEVVAESMETLFELLEQEREPAVRAVLGHWLFGYIHPYPDGNGRLARFLMNLMLASGGYPWTTIRVEDRRPYMAALEAASVDRDIVPFAEFVGRCVGS
ncbi:MAG: Fic family protein [Gammaproteobacteria bacterium]|nr:Fic family protein [Gammaproteobacteria bacterium]